MAAYYPFFGGAATVAGALIGLLFVALSLPPERLRDAGSIEHQAIAATAFTALVDALFVSLIGLQPGGGLQHGAVIFGALGLSSTVGLNLRLWRNRHLAHLSNRWPLFLVVIMAVYAAQRVTGLLPETRRCGRPYRHVRLRHVRRRHRPRVAVAGPESRRDPGRARRDHHPVRSHRLSAFSSQFRAAFR